MDKKEAKIRFFSLHINQQVGVYFPDPNGEIVASENDFLSGVIGNMAHFSSCGVHAISDCQLILRPVTATTRTEREEILAIKSKGLNNYESAIQTIDYLRSRGFLINFMEFNPVHEFWAVTF